MAIVPDCSPIVVRIVDAACSTDRGCGDISRVYVVARVSVLSVTRVGVLSVTRVGVLSVARVGVLSVARVGVLSVARVDVLIVARVGVLIVTSIGRFVGHQRINRSADRIETQTTVIAVRICFADAFHRQVVSARGQCA